MSGKTESKMRLRSMVLIIAVTSAIRVESTSWSQVCALISLSSFPRSIFWCYACWGHVKRTAHLLLFACPPLMHFVITGQGQRRPVPSRKIGVHYSGEMATLCSVSLHLNLLYVMQLWRMPLINLLATMIQHPAVWTAPLVKTRPWCITHWCEC